MTMKLLYVLLLVHLCLSQEEEGGESNIEGSSSTQKSTTPEEKEEDLPLENEAGPTRFYYEKGKMPKFLMEVSEGIMLTVYKDGKEFDRFLLNEEASGGISGGLNKVSTDSKEFQVDIDWKQQTFSGLNNPNNKIMGLQLEMIFDIVQNNFELVDMRIINLEGRYDIDLKVTTVHGYAVKAPIGLSFGCSSPGRFRDRDNDTNVGTSAALTLPDVRLQVYEVRRGRFGPLWECGVMIPIGLWVGLLVTLGFALVCAYGFSMLANINTMDRFDDPKGKCIYVPNTD